MHIFDYKEAPKRLLTPEITALIADIREYKGKQSLYETAHPDVHATLLKIAKALDWAGLVERSASEIQRLIGLANHTRFKRQWLDPLMEDSLLVYTVPDRPRSRYQKYRLTEKARALLNNQPTNLS